jgi:aspartate-semialdehyde dehydrogenase
MVRVAIMGATGAVGREMLKILEQRQFPCSSLKLLASKRSKGKKIPFRGRLLEVELLEKTSFTDVDLVLASAGGSVSKEFAPAAVDDGAVVIDNTSAFRMDKDVPLVVPEVNPEDIREHKGIIANPNCSTIQMVVALKPIYDEVGIKRLVISTYQAVSGTGTNAIEELMQQTSDILDGAPVECEVYPHQIAFNCLPHIDVFFENGYTREELKMVNETHKIFHDQDIAITATTVRIPVIRSHSESVNVETRKKISVERVKEILSKAPGIVVVDDPSKNEYPLAIYGEGHDETYVGRIREDFSIENGLNLWIVSDNLRKGAALNAVQIGEEMIKMGLLK